MAQGTLRLGALAVSFFVVGWLSGCRTEGEATGTGGDLPPPGADAGEADGGLGQNGDPYLDGGSSGTLEPAEPDPGTTSAGAPDSDGGSSAPPGGATGGDPTNGGSLPLSGPAAELLGLINAAREEAGCSPLTAVRRATDAAMACVTEFAQQDHAEACLSTFNERLQAHGLSFGAAGEVFGSGRDAGGMFGSMTERQRTRYLLNCEYNQVGIAIEAGEGGRLWGVVTLLRAGRSSSTSSDGGEGDSGGDEAVDTGALQRSILNRINEVRAGSSCEPLTLEHRLHDISQPCADQMARARDFVCTRTDKVEALEANGFQLEDVTWATGYATNPDPRLLPQAVVDGTARITDCSYELIGIGVGLDSNGEAWASVDLIAP